MGTRYTSPGQHKTLAEFRTHLVSLDPEFDCAEHLLAAEGPLGRPLEIGGRTIGNRFATQPMEGWDSSADGLPTEPTLRRWRRFGKSGAKLFWGGEAFAVQEDGRANPNQLYLNPEVDIEAALVALRSEVFAGHTEIGEPSRSRAMFG